MFWLLPPLLVAFEEVFILLGLVAVTMGVAAFEAVKKLDCMEQVVKSPQRRTLRTDYGAFRRSCCTSICRWSLIAVVDINLNGGAYVDNIDVGTLLIHT